MDTEAKSEEFTVLPAEHNDSLHNHTRLNYHDHLEGSTKRAIRKLILACVASFLFMIIEIVAGYLSNSLALLTDASHLFSDVCAFLLSLFAIWVSNFKGNHKMSFGYHRAEILGALCSILLIWALTVFLVYTAILRILSPKPVGGTIMLITACFGTISNLFITYILKVHHHGIGSDHHHHDHEPSHETSSHEKSHQNNYAITHAQFTDIIKLDPKSHSSAPTEPLLGSINSSEPYTLMSNNNEHFNHNGPADHSESNSNPINQEDVPVATPPENINLKAAYLHALGDLIQNIGVVIAGFIIWLEPTWSIVDPICTLLFSVLVIYTTFSILKEALNVLMEATPVNIDTLKLQDSLSSIRGVLDIHDLHVWSLSVGKPSLACHLVIEDEKVHSFDVLKIATAICQMQFGILHTTIQIDFKNKALACATKAHCKCN